MGREAFYCVKGIGIWGLGDVGRIKSGSGPIFYIKPYLSLRARGITK